MYPEHARQEADDSTALASAHPTVVGYYAPTNAGHRGHQEEEPMSDGPTGDPIFESSPLTSEGNVHPIHEHKTKADDWVVVDRVSGEGGKSRLESAHRELEHAGITARVEHDHEHRPVLEVHRDDEHKALGVLGRKHGHGAPRESSEEQIEAEEHEALRGPFKAASTRWVLIVVAVAVGLLLAGWWLMYLPK